MHTRGTSVWEVYGVDQPTTEPFVLKQPRTSNGSQGRVAVIRKAEVIAGDAPDLSTATLSAADTHPSQRKETKAVRVILSSPQVPLLQHFQTPIELIRTLLDTIRGHECLYINGFLHRDICPANILVMRHSDVEKRVTGCCTGARLIDLDRLKQGARTDSPRLLPRNHGNPERPEHRLKIQAAALADSLCAGDNLKIHHTVMRAAYIVTKDLLECYNYSLAAIKHHLAFSASGTEEAVLMTPEHLGWQQVERNADFAASAKTAQRDVGLYMPLVMVADEIYGASPYTSQEVLGGFVYSGVSTPLEYHDAVHDMESFFWILVNVCLTRSGLGNSLRPELAEDDDNSGVLRQVVHRVFNGDTATIVLNKKRIFELSDAFKQDILDNFHPYFERLKPFVHEWFGLLSLAYHHRELYEYHTIHKRVITILEKALQTGEDCSMAMPSEILAEGN